MTNEWEFQGQALVWIKEIINERHTPLETVTQEFTNSQGKRSDIVFWTDRAARVALLEMELKPPSVALHDSEFQRDAVRKAQKIGAPWLALWNVKTLQLFRTPDSPRKDLLAADRIKEIGTIDAVVTIDDWIDPMVSAELRTLARDLVIAASDLAAGGSGGGLIVDATVFASTLSDHASALRGLLLSDIDVGLSADRSLRNRVNRWAANQGLSQFVDDLHDALASQLTYRLIGQILFYFAFRRHETGLPDLLLDDSSSVASQLRTYWDAIRAFDYEALYEPSTLEEIPIRHKTGKTIATMVADLTKYDWNAIEDDVLGSMFENMIPERERISLGQYYTPTELADLVVSACAGPPGYSVLDPALGTGTFLLRAHSRESSAVGTSHHALLEQLWGIDISAFPAELAVINLSRQDLSSRGNFPRVVVKDFFDVNPGDSFDLPPARIVGSKPGRVAVRLPAFDAVIGNPPYVRSQQLDDLEASYKQKLRAVGANAGIHRDAKFDAFAYFIVHAAEFLDAGGRLGFVTSAAWLTAAYGGPLQRFILDNFQPILLVSSEVEPFFPAQEINTVVVILERLDLTNPSTLGDARFVTLEQRLVELVSPDSAADYWNRMDELASQFEIAQTGSYEGYRVSVVDMESELNALRHAPKEPRNWARPLRQTQMYRDLFV